MVPCILLQPMECSRGASLRAFAAALVLASGTCILAQTTQGLIAGRLVDSVTGAPLASAVVIASGASAAEVRGSADAAGYFCLPLLSPGTYRLRVTAEAHQAQEMQELILPVAGRLEIDFRLRPLS